MAWIRLVVALIAAACFVQTASAKTEVDRSFEKFIDAPGVGKIRLSYKYAGEPMAEPATMDILVKCDGMRSDVLVQSTGVCSYDSHDYVKTDKKLTVTVIQARVDISGKVTCDQKTELNHDLGSFCKQAWRKKLDKKPAPAKRQ